MPSEALPLFIVIDRNSRLSRRESALSTACFGANNHVYIVNYEKWGC